MDRAWLRAVFATQQWKDEVLPAMVNKRNELTQTIAREEAYSGRSVVSTGLVQSVAQLDVNIARAKSVEREIIQNGLDMSDTNPYTGFLQGINVDDNIVRQTLASEYNIVIPSSYSQEGLRQIRLLGWENAIRKGYVSNPQQIQQQFQLFPQAFAESEQQDLSQTSGLILSMPRVPGQTISERGAGESVPIAEQQPQTDIFGNVIPAYEPPTTISGTRGQIRYEDPSINSGVKSNPLSTIGQVIYGTVQETIIDPITETLGVSPTTANIPPPGTQQGLFPAQPPSDSSSQLAPILQCADVYRWENGKVALSSGKFTLTQLQGYISQGLMIRDCNTTRPTEQQVKDHYGIVTTDDIPPPETPPGQTTDDVIPSHSAGFGIAGILFAGVLAIPILAGLGKWK